MQVADMCPSCVPLRSEKRRRLIVGFVQVRGTWVRRLKYRRIQQTRHSRRRMGAFALARLFPLLHLADSRRQQFDISWQFID